MPPTENVDGRHYTSKRAFRAVSRALGLTEVGSEKPKPKQRTIADPRKRRAAISKAVAQYRAGRRIKT